MRFKKSACALLLGGGLSILNIGCAAVDALVSSPAGYSAGSGSPQRVVAIGRVFENQGRYSQARAMYRQALRADANNTTARDRLEYLASLQNPAVHETAVTEAVAAADAIGPRQRVRKPTTPAQQDEAETVIEEQPEESAIRMVRASEPVGRVESAVLSVGGELESAIGSHPLADSAVNPPPRHFEAAGSEVDADVDSVGQVTFTSDPVEVVSGLDDDFSDSPGVTSRQDVSRHFEVDRDDEDDESVAEILTGPERNGGELNLEVEQFEAAGLWRPSRTSVSLEDVLEWSDVPGRYIDELIGATHSGADQGVKALAVALLGEVEQPGPEVMTALKQAAESGVPMIQVAALDALVVLGKSDFDTIDHLLSLLAGDQAGIRTQAAATLHRMADTESQDAAIAGLHRLLDDENDEVVAVAATSLSEFGSAAVFCRERLTAVAATTSSELVLEATSMALSRIPRS